MQARQPAEFIRIVYVDEPFDWPLQQVGKQARKHGTSWCHLWTDPGSEEGLHRIAAAIGLKRSWFQDRQGFPHYDIVPSKRAAAIAAGAVLTDLRLWLQTHQKSI